MNTIEKWLSRQLSRNRPYLQKEFKTVWGEAFYRYIVSPLLVVFAIVVIIVFLYVFQLFAGGTLYLWLKFLTDIFNWLIGH